MKLIRRIAVVFAGVVLLVGVAVQPASAHDTSFIFVHPTNYGVGVFCPHPYLVSGFGPVAHCTSAPTGGRVDVGFYSPLTGEFNIEHARLVDVEGTMIERDAVAEDGIKGRFKGIGVAATSFGGASFGVQYIYFGFQPIGRWGSYNVVDGKFHSTSGWAYAEHAF